MMVEVIRATARAGSGDSAAAIVTTSAPIIDQMTVVTAASTANGPRGAKPPIGGQGRERRPRWRAIAEGVRANDDNEDHDGRDLDRGEPELELAVGARGHEIHTCHAKHQRSPDLPRRQQRQPALDDPRSGDCLDRDHDHPEVPVQPADGESGPVSERRPGELGERAHLRHLDRHLAEHAHDQQDQEARQRVTDENRGACGGDCHAAADEEPCADDAADGDHRHVPRPQRAAESVLIRRGARHCVHHCSPVSAAASPAASGRGPGSTGPATGRAGPETSTRQANSRLRC